MNDLQPTTVAIAGAAGRMGQRLCALAMADDRLDLIEAFESPDHPALGQPAAGADGPAITDRFEARADVLIDFTTPAATTRLLQTCLEHRRAMIIGTTGMGEDLEKAIDQAAATIPIVQAPNFSLVVTVLNKLAGEAARMLGDSYDIEITEAHHRFKKDAPSGTAIGLARTICDATGRNFDDDVVFERHGDHEPRKPRQIAVQAIRLGDVVGEHTVHLATMGERMALQHIGTSRDSYATGALHAVRWAINQPPGRYTMADVLGLGRGD
jgi:4-hydroxy-tetrahydrodipicolinate reductase